MSLFTDIRDSGRITAVEELFDSPSAASETGVVSAEARAQERTTLGKQIQESRGKALTLGAGTAAERREGAAGFAKTAFENSSLSGVPISSVPDPSKKVSVREATRMDFAAVTAPHLLLEKKGQTARGEGVISKKR